MQERGMNDPSFALITGVPFLFMSMMLFWAGLFGLRGHLDIFTVITPEAYNYIKIIFLAVALVFSIISLRDGWLTEGLTFMVICISGLSTSIAMLRGLTEIYQLDLVYGIIIMFCSLFMIYRRVVFRGLASLLVGVALAVPGLTDQDLGLLPYFLLIASATFYFIYFGYVMYHTDDDKKMTMGRKANSALKGHVVDVYEVVVVIGCLMMGLMLMFDAGVSLAGLKMSETSVVVSLALLSIVSVVVSVFASVKGELAEAVMILMIAIYYLFVSLSMLGGFEVEPTAVDFVTSAVMFSTFMAFLKRGNVILMITSILMFTEGVLLVFFDINSQFIAWYTLVEAIFCLYSAISVWAVVELKWEVLPVLDKYTFRRRDE